MNAISKPRVDWVDYAKGICIFFVVMLHTNEHVQNYLGGRGWLQEVVEFARPFRMPDFFLIAGLFLRNVIDRPWKTYLDKKVVHFMYFYALWTTIEFLLFDVRYALRDGVPVSSLWSSYLLLYIDPVGSLWFIHSLPIYFVVTRLLKPVPWWIVWTVAAVLQSLDVNSGWTVIDQGALRFVYFYSGYIFSPYVFRAADWALARPRLALASVLAWGVLEEFFVMKGWSKLPALSLVLGYIGAGAVIFVSCLLCRLPWMNWLRYLGQHSIVVYLGYYTAMAVSLRALARLVPDIGSAALLVTIASVAISVIMYRLADKGVLSFLYNRPAWAHLRLPMQVAASPQTSLKP